MIKAVEKAIERLLGEPIEKIRNTTIDERRLLVERKTGSVTAFRRVFPLIGRGNVTTDRALTREEIEKKLDLRAHGK